MTTQAQKPRTAAVSALCYKSHSHDDERVRLMPLPPQQREQMEAGHTTGPDVRALATFFDRTYRHYCQSVLWGILVALLSIGPLLFWCGTLAGAATGAASEGAFWFASALLALCIGSCVRLFSMPAALRRSAEMLVASDSVHAAGPLLDIFYSGGASLRDDAAKVPLMRALRRLTDEMAGHEAAEVLPEAHRQVLRQTLVAPLNGYGGEDDRFKYDPPYLLAALKAVGHIGDTAAAPEVERLAEESRHPEVRTAARDCLLRLRGWE